MVQLQTILAHQDNRQLRIMGHMVKIQTSKEFKINIASSCKNSTELYQDMFKHTPVLVIMEEALFTPCINTLMDKTEVILITADKSKIDSENIHYVYLPVQPVTIMQKVLQIVKNSSLIQSQDAVRTLLNSLHFPSDYCKTIDYFVEGRHWLQKFGIDYIEQREKIYSAMQTGEFDPNSKEQDHADTSFDIDGLYNPAVRSLLGDYEDNPFAYNPNPPVDTSPVTPVYEEEPDKSSTSSYEVYQNEVDEPQEQPQDIKEYPSVSTNKTSTESDSEPFEAPSYDSRYATPAQDNRFTRPYNPVPDTYSQPVEQPPSKQETFIPDNEVDMMNEQDEEDGRIKHDVGEDLAGEVSQEELYHDSPQSAEQTSVAEEPAYESEPISELDSVYSSEEASEANVNPDEVVNMEWDVYPRKEVYAIGELPEISDGIIVAIYGDGRRESIHLTDDMLTNIRYTQPGEQMGIIELFGFTIQIPLRYTDIRLKQILIKKPPIKLVYTEGEHLDLTGFEMEKVFSDGTKAPLTNYQYDDVPLTCNMKTITLCYGRRRCHLFVQVNSAQSEPKFEVPKSATSDASTEKKHHSVKQKPITRLPKAAQRSLIGIDIQHYPKQKYAPGESLDVSGGVLEVSFSDDSKESIQMKPNMISGFNSQKVGNQLLIVSYLGERCSYEIVVERKLEIVEEDVNLALQPDNTSALLPDSMVENNQELNIPDDETRVDYQEEVPNVPERMIIGIEFVNKERKTNYANGERIKRSDFRIQLNYNDGTYEFADNFEMAPSDVVTIDTKEILVSYGDFYLSSPVTVSGKQLVALMLDSQPNKLEYVLGDTILDMTGAKATLFYTDQSFETVDVNPEWVSGFNGAKAGKQVLTVSVQDKVANFTVNVMDREVSNISITKMPMKIKYHEGEVFDPSGMEVAVKYNDGYFGERAPFSYPKEPLKTGDSSIMISVGDKSVPVFIEVEESSVVRIAMESLPRKTVYLEGERNFDPSGGLIAKYSSSGDKDIVPLSTVQYTGFSSVKAGICRILVTVEQCTCEFEVSIMKKDLISLKIHSMPIKSVYAEGDSFDPTGLVLSAEYNDGSVSNVTNYVVPPKFLTMADSFVTVKYETMTVDVPIKVSGRQIESIAVSKMPDKMVYQERKELLDMTGAQLLVVYADGDSSVVDITNDMVSGFNNTVVGVNTIRINYGGMFTTLSLQISSAALIGISIQKNPDKMDYNVGDFFDRTGMEIIAFYDNGTQSLLNHYSVIPNTPLTNVDSSVEITYMNKSITLPITIHANNGSSYSGLPTSEGFYPDTSGLRFDDDEDEDE